MCHLVGGTKVPTRIGPTAVTAVTARLGNMSDAVARMLRAVDYLTGLRAVVTRPTASLQVKT